MTNHRLERMASSSPEERTPRLLHHLPLVSVVIPTRNRPETVLRAARSALAQTLDEIEVVIIIDGPDPCTVRSLSKIEDEKLVVKKMGQNLGAGAARNAGVKEAKSKWISFLDDDDEWLPEKLEVQLRTAEQSAHSYPIVTCRLIARSEAGDVVWPRKLPSSDQPLSEYLFCQNGLLAGEGLVLTSAIFTKRALLNQIPFRADLSRHNDVDWLLRAIQIKGAQVEFVRQQQPLLIWHIEENRPRISNSTDWRFSLKWGQHSRDLFTSKAYGSFVLRWVSVTAAKGRKWEAFLPLLREVFRTTKPRPIDLLAHLLIWVVPARFRRKAGVFMARKSFGHPLHKRT